MPPSDPILVALVYGSLAALAAALGALPFSRERKEAPLLVGSAYALAGGVMVGAGYLLGIAGLDRGTLSSASGALIGVVLSFWTLRFTSHEEEPPEGEQAESKADLDTGYRVLLQNTLHSASEGVAIGVALAVSTAFGIFVALALGLHNIAEGTVLAGILRRRGMGVGECAGLAVVTKLSQPLMAVTTLVLLAASPSLLPAVLGFAAGSLLFLVLAELAPGAYDLAGRELVALLLSAAAAAVLLVEDLLL